MSFFSGAQDTIIQGGSQTAVDGDQHIYNLNSPGAFVISDQHSAGDHHLCMQKGEYWVTYECAI